MGKFIDLTGTTINEITILCKDEELSKQKGRLYWKCQCSCGRIKSIRSDGLKKIKTCGECNKNLIGQKFGRLLVLEKGKKDKAQHQYYICKCDCGNICEINSDNLRRGLTKSCGCLHSEITHKNTFKDITGQKFGKLTAINYEIKNSKVYWKCKCDCGNEILVFLGHLQNGHTTSCGCDKSSKGEKEIASLLDAANLNYIHDKQYFKDLILPSGGIGRYDYIILDKNNAPQRIIEFDGEQHFKDCWSSVENVKLNDEVKNKYAFEHNIPIVRIPYWERNNITLDMLMGDIYEIQMAPDMEEAQGIEEGE